MVVWIWEKTNISWKKSLGGKVDFNLNTMGKQMKPVSSFHTTMLITKCTKIKMSIFLSSASSPIKRRRKSDPHHLKAVKIKTYKYL